MAGLQNLLVPAILRFTDLLNSWQMVKPSVFLYVKIIGNSFGVSKTETQTICL